MRETPEAIDPDAAASVAYACKFCRKAGVARYNPAFVHVLDSWVKMLACNPCADYHVSLRRIEDQLWKAAHVLIVARNMGVKNLSTIEDNARNRLDALTKQYAQLVTAYYGLANFWDQEFPSMIMDKPEKLNKIAKGYRASVRQMSRQLNPNQP